MTDQQFPPEPPLSQGEVNSGLAPHRGNLILALGIIGIVCCVICGIIAWVMGRDDLRKMTEGRMDPSGRGTTQAGMICGIVSVALAVLGLAAGLIMMMIGIGTSGMHL